jgi:hypothetical protein
VKYQLPDNYYQTFDQSVRNLTIDDIHKVTHQLVKKDRLQWFVVGDMEKILPGLKELGFDEIVLVDADGNPVDQKSKVKKP